MPVATSRATSRPRSWRCLPSATSQLGRVRRQPVGVLFADLVGFTSMAEDMTPEEVMAMLRDFHGRMEAEVFRHGGCLEKFIGDALLATFGVPNIGPRDATDTLACARGMLAALKTCPQERTAGGLAPMRMGLGLHYGPVVAGDIGSQRSMAFATVGDTTNVTSRLQSLTRDLGATIVVSAALVEAVRRESADLAVLDGLMSQGPHSLRGRRRRSISGRRERVARPGMAHPAPRSAPKHASSTPLPRTSARFTVVRQAAYRPVLRVYDAPPERRAGVLEQGHPGVAVLHAARASSLVAVCAQQLCT